MELELTIDEAKAQLLRVDPNWDQQDKSFRVAMILLFGSFNGKFSVIQLKEHLQYDRSEIAEVVRTLKREKIWIQNPKLFARKEFPWVVQASDWFNEKTGGIGFLLDVNRAQGYITCLK